MFLVLLLLIILAGNGEQDASECLSVHVLMGSQASYVPCPPSNHSPLAGNGEQDASECQRDLLWEDKGRC